MTSSCSDWKRDTNPTKMPEKNNPSNPFSTPDLGSTTKPSSKLLLPITDPTSLLISPQTSTPTPSETPLPTLEPTEAKEKMDFLMDQNGGCELPCWWSITPGETKINDIRSKVQPFLLKIQSHEYKWNDTEEERKAIWTGVYNDQTDETIQFSVVFVDDFVKRIYVYEDLTENFSMSVLLKKYGQPQQILLKTEPASPTGKTPYSLILSFPEKGILAHFFVPYDGGKIQGENIYICPDMVLPELRLWQGNDTKQGEIELNRLIKDIELNNSFGGKEYQPLNEISDLTIEKFYVGFQNSPNFCIVSNAEQWWNL